MTETLNYKSIKEFKYYPICNACKEKGPKQKERPHWVKTLPNFSFPVRCYIWYFSYFEKKSSLQEKRLADSNQKKIKVRK